MRVFILGATGYIGNNVAKAFRRDGHDVWGLTRKPEKAELLMKDEIHPVIGRMQDPESYSAIARNADLIVHAAADAGADMGAEDRKTVEILLRIAQSDSAVKTLIYTSGVWVHGDTDGSIVNELSPLNPIRIVAWRPDVERMILNDSRIRGIVLRPGVVYGKQGGMTGLWFDQVAHKIVLSVVGEGKNSWAMVHVDDLAEAYLLAAHRGSKGEVFDIADGSCSTIQEIVEAVSRSLDYRGTIKYRSLEEAVSEMGAFTEALAISQRIDSSKARNILGWEPKHRDFVHDVVTYFKSWKAAQSEKLVGVLR